MRKTFPTLWYIWSEGSWVELAGQFRNRWSTFQSGVQQKGYMGDIYPNYQYAVEGDAAWLYSCAGAPNNPEDPSTSSFAGHYVKALTLDGSTS